MIVTKGYGQESNINQDIVMNVNVENISEISLNVNVEEDDISIFIGSDNVKIDIATDKIEVEVL